MNMVLYLARVRPDDLSGPIGFARDPYLERTRYQLL